MKNTIPLFLLAIILMVFFNSCGRDSSTTPGTASIYFDWWDEIPPASYDPLVIVAAPIGLELSYEEYPSVPFPADRDEYLDEVVECYNSGASVVHLVPIGLDPDTAGSMFDWGWDNYTFMIDYVTENCPGMLIWADIAGAGSDVVDSLIADTLVSFVSPVFGRYLYDGEWAGSDAPAFNGSEILYWQLADVKVLPFVVSPQQADYIARYLLTSYLTAPFHFPIAIGWENNTASTPEVLSAMINTLPDTSTKIIACTQDNPTELMGLAIADGHHLVVGMKYAVYWPGDTFIPLSSTAFMVDKAVELAAQMNREIATPEEARILLDAYR